MTIRFQLDQGWAKNAYVIEKHMPVAGYDYDGPNEVQELKCQKCESLVGKMREEGKKLKLK